MSETAINTFSSSFSSANLAIISQTGDEESAELFDYAITDLLEEDDLGDAQGFLDSDIEYEEDSIGRGHQAGSSNKLVIVQQLECTTIWTPAKRKGWMVRCYRLERIKVLRVRHYSIEGEVCPGTACRGQEWGSYPNLSHGTGPQTSMYFLLKATL